MIIYNKAGLANLYLQNQAEQAHDAALLTAPELTTIKNAYPTGFYTPNRIIRVGFFILTLIGSLFAGLLLSLLFEGIHIVDHPVWPLLLGLGTYAVLEFFVKGDHLFRSGIDDALLWLTASLLTGSFIWAVSGKENEYQLISGFILLLSLYFTLRFADALMGVAASLSFLALIFFTWNKTGIIGQATMPFVIMLFSYLIFYSAVRAGKNPKHTIYQNCLAFMQLISLLTLYAAGNYFVVQILSNILHQLPEKTNTTLPFGWFFWLWTMLLPWAYIGFGIKSKSLLLLRTGLLLVVAAALTFRAFYHLLPAEYAFVMAGTTLLLLVWLIIKYLKTPQKGFTYAQRSRRHWASNIQLESLVVAGVAHAPAAPPASTDRFGGGSFGGGGSSSDF